VFAERALRAAGLLALIVLAARLWSATRAPAGDVRTGTAGLDSSLVQWAAVHPAQVVVDADTLPTRQQRDWLVALRRTGTGVRWTSRDSSGGALVVDAGPLPGSPARVVALTMPSRAVTLSDALGDLDSATAAGNGAVAWRASPIGVASAYVGNAMATAAPRDSFLVRPVLVVGQAGWESRFAITALEESGWSVAARLSVAPGALVRQDVPARLDTATLSAMVVLDSASSLHAGDVARFVRQGGGVIASGPGTRNPAIRSILPPVRDGTPGEIGGLLGPSPHSGLSTRTFVAGAGSVPLERRGNAPVVLARRVGSGRVIAIGYEETWRLRMVPVSESAPEAHRAWWSSLVGGVALVRPVTRDVGVIDEAPMASTVESLGPPSGVSAAGTRQAPWPWDVMLAVLAGVAMLGEWLSRRLRGLA
jgi:hypothetical protein